MHVLSAWIIGQKNLLRSSRSRASSSGTSCTCRACSLRPPEHVPAWRNPRAAHPLHRPCNKATPLVLPGWSALDANCTMSYKHLAAARYSCIWQRITCWSSAAACAHAPPPGPNQAHRPAPAALHAEGLAQQDRRCAMPVLRRAQHYSCHCAAAAVALGVPEPEKASTAIASECARDTVWDWAAQKNEAVDMAVCGLLQGTGLPNYSCHHSKAHHLSESILLHVVLPASTTPGPMSSTHNCRCLSRWPALRFQNSCPTVFCCAPVSNIVVAW